MDVFLANPTIQGFVYEWHTADFESNENTDPFANVIKLLKETHPANLTSFFETFGSIIAANINDERLAEAVERMIEKDLFVRNNMHNPSYFQSINFPA